MPDFLAYIANEGDNVTAASFNALFDAAYAFLEGAVSNDDIAVRAGIPVGVLSMQHDYDVIWTTLMHEALPAGNLVRFRLMPELFMKHSSCHIEKLYFAALTSFATDFAFDMHVMRDGDIVQTATQNVPVALRAVGTQGFITLTQPLSVLRGDRLVARIFTPGTRRVAIAGLFLRYAR